MALLRIGERLVGDGHEPIMFAEEGQANQGDFTVAVDMCKKAAAAGADGIEFQLFLADDMYIQSDPGHAIYRSRELSEAQIRDLIKIAHGEGLLFQAASLSTRIIELCADASADVFCVNATDLTNPAIIDAVIAAGRPFWLATLMATMEEIDWAVGYVKSRGAADFGILHGQHVMSSDTSKGVPSGLLQLDCIHLLKNRYNVVTGFVDHTATVFVPALAATKGASVVMKHLAPGKDWSGPDSVVCLDPEMWASARSIVRYAWDSKGDSKEISQAEIKDRSLHRRSIYTAQPLTAGHVIAAGDLTALRPGKGGMDPRNLHELTGRRIVRDCTKHHQLQPDDLA